MPGAVLHVLALSDICEEFLRKLALDGLVVVPLSKILNSEPRLCEARKSRSATEFIFTLTPYIVCHALNKVQEGEQVVYLDADMMFFSSPASILENSKNFDISITPHNFSSHHKHKIKCGIYNVGWVGFSKNKEGIKCAKWWAEKCLEWCYEVVEEDRYADQKYLNKFPSICKQALIINNKGFNCAPWNASNKSFKNHNEIFSVDGEQLILYHFSHVKRVSKHVIASRLRQQYVINSCGLKAYVYKQYAIKLDLVSNKYKIPSNYFLSKKKLRSYDDLPKLNRDFHNSKILILYRLMFGDYVYGRKD